MRIDFSTYRWPTLCRPPEAHSLLRGGGSHAEPVYQLALRSSSLPISLSISGDEKAEQYRSLSNPAQPASPQEDSVRAVPRATSGGHHGRRTKSANSRVDSV